MYDIQKYGEMIDDQARMAAYRQAIARVVFPGAVVLDLGTGTGVIAMLACLSGARHVYAIEPSNAIEIARENAAANGLSDRITFYQDKSGRVSLPERVDVIIEDLRGALPWLGRHIPDLIDARRRFLKPGGAIISSRDVAYCAVVEHGHVAGELERVWSRSVHGLDLTAGRRCVLASFHRPRVALQDLLTDAHAWAELDYATLEEANARGRFELRFVREGTAHGILLWFDGELAPGVTLRNGPGSETRCYQPLFLALAAPVSVQPGDVAAVRLRCDLVDDSYIWTWDVSIHRPDDPARPASRTRHSSFFAMPVTRRVLARSAPDHVPVRDEDGEVTYLVLTGMDGAATLAEIGERLRARFPMRYRTAAAAFAEAVSISTRFGR